MPLQSEYPDFKGVKSGTRRKMIREQRTHRGNVGKEGKKDTTFITSFVTISVQISPTRLGCSLKVTTERKWCSGPGPSSFSQEAIHASRVCLLLAAECRLVLADCNCSHLLLSRDDWRKARYVRTCSTAVALQFPLFSSHSSTKNRDRNTKTHLGRTPSSRQFSAFISWGGLPVYSVYPGYFDYFLTTRSRSCQIWHLGSRT